MERGGLFRPATSSTWHALGPYALGLDPQLEFGGYGAYGFDSIALSDRISVPSQIVGVINTTDYWLGLLGLGIKPTNFTSDDTKTFLSNMIENQSLIPSHSYGFTSGAHYREQPKCHLSNDSKLTFAGLKSVPASLTLGGYDTTRFEPHNVSFALDPDQNPVIGLVTISVTADPLPSNVVSVAWNDASVALLGSGNAGLYTIDSSTPYLWLPEEVCKQFEKALGLVYDEDLQLFTFGSNTTQHQTLQNWNLTFTFVVADSPGSLETISLTVPYDAFDLQLSYPFPGLRANQSSPPTNYFPLRKAANNTQYTIGRAFLQETYLIVDYERNNFSIHQAAFSTDALEKQDLVDVSRPSNSTSASDLKASLPLGKGAQIAIAIGSVFTLVCLAFCAVYCYLWRRRRLAYGRATYVETSQETRNHEISTGVDDLDYQRMRELTPEVDGRVQQPNEASTEGEIMELPLSTTTELHGDHIETSCRLGKTKMTQCTVCAIGHDPAKPVELHDYCG